jgi:hypothetical protein
MAKKFGCDTRIRRMGKGALALSVMVAPHIAAEAGFPWSERFF